MMEEPNRETTNEKSNETMGTSPNEDNDMMAPNTQNEREESNETTWAPTNAPE